MRSTEYTSVPGAVLSHVPSTPSSSFVYPPSCPLLRVPLSPIHHIRLLSCLPATVHPLLPASSLGVAPTLVVARLDRRAPRCGKDEKTNFLSTSVSIHFHPSQLATVHSAQRDGPMHQRAVSIADPVCCPFVPPPPSRPEPMSVPKSTHPDPISNFRLSV